jgi:hypothetical protein
MPATLEREQPILAPPRRATGFLQRRCTCGGTPDATGECAACRRRRQRGHQTAPPIVHEALRKPGAPLNHGVRATMERRFGGHDFSRVRVHTGGQAAESNRAVGALAYTVGPDIVFGAGRDALDTRVGRRVLAHELTHVVQDGSTPPAGKIGIASPDSPEERAAESNERLGGGTIAPSVLPSEQLLRRKGGTFGGFFANIGRELADIFTGSEPDYDAKTLKDYLKYLRDQNEIEDDFDSDNKARGVVKAGLFKAEDLRVRILLIQEMMSGAVLDADEQAILTIIEAAPTSERTEIGASVKYRRLHDAFDGSELDRLYVLLPLMNTFEPRDEKNDWTESTMAEYIEKWEKDHGRPLAPAERTVLAKGCIGITMLNLGTLTSPDLSNCFGAFEDAWRISKKMNEFLAGHFPERRAIIFSKRFWSGGKDYTPDPASGHVDMSGYDFSTRPGEGFTNFDYGFYDEATNKWWHANHCDSAVFGSACRGSMKVYESTLTHYSRPLADFDAQVFCVGISTLE